MALGQLGTPRVRPRPLVSQPRPPLLERAASKVAHVTTFVRSGHPLLGDELHGGSRAAALAPRLCLHAVALSFEHPDGKSGRLSLSSRATF